jgi:preprotein translocase subunit YajC
MSFFIQQAYAASGAVGQAGSSPEGIMSMMPMMLVFFGLMYFMVLRPQQKRAKDHKSLMADLSPGDEIATAGGIVGKLSKVDDQFVVLSVADGFDMMLQKTSVASVLPKGTMKNNKK